MSGLGRLYAAQRGMVQAAGIIIRQLAETIDDGELREGFVTAVATQTILPKNA